MELLLWDSGFRFAPAGLVALVGLWLTFVGGWRQVRYLKLPTGTRGKNHGWVRAMRQMIQGMSLLAIGLGWAWQLPVMMVAGAVFGFEETIETSIATSHNEMADTSIRAARSRARFAAFDRRRSPAIHQSSACVSTTTSAASVTVRPTTSRRWRAGPIRPS